MSDIAYVSTSLIDLANVSIYVQLTSRLYEYIRHIDKYIMKRDQFNLQVSDCHPQ